MGGPTIQEVDGKMMMGLSIYGVAVISESLYSRFYGIPIYWNSEVYTVEPLNKGPIGMSHYVPYLEVSFTGRLNNFL